MKAFILILAISFSLSATAQTNKIELYDLVKSFIPDSTGYENVGDWAVGSPKTFNVKWDEDALKMSDDTSINFFRKGSAYVTINGKIFSYDHKPLNWSVWLQGPRMGYTSFSISSFRMTEGIKARSTIDSIFGKKPFTAKLLKSCDANFSKGYYFYELKLPKKDIAYLLLNWVAMNDKTFLQIDCFDSYSKYAAKLDCK